MHVNPRQPNILQDMQASARGLRLHNPLSKRHLIPSKFYYIPNYKPCKIGVDRTETRIEVLRVMKLNDASTNWAIRRYGKGIVRRAIRVAHRALAKQAEAKG